MKKQHVVVLLLLLSLRFSLLYGQECKTAYYFNKGKEITFSKYDKNGKSIGSEVGIVKEVLFAEGKLIARYRVVKYDVDGKVKEDGTAEVICNGGNLKIGFQIPESGDGNVKEAFFEYPANMNPGQTLQASMDMDIKTKLNGKKTDIAFRVENRKVVGKEKIKIPSGNYDTVKIQYDMSVKFKVLGIAIPMKLKVVEWYSPGVGLVKSESYNKDGQLEETSVLTAIK